MNSILWRATLLLLLSVGLLKGQDPRWGFLGDDGALEAAFDEAKGVVFVCVFETELRDVRPPFAEVVYHAAVIESHKGKLKVGEKIEISFRTDSLPQAEGERRKFVEKADKRSKGSLKFAFLHGGEKGAYFCEFMDVPTYSKEMQDFLRKLQSRPLKSHAEQNSAHQSTTRFESKSE